jgi:hypothetical protein
MILSRAHASILTHIYVKIVPLYSRIIERLEHLEPTAEIIANLGHMLVSPMGRCPPPGVTSDDFHRYWTATYHHRKAEFYDHYPDELKRCMRDFEMVYGWRLTEGFSQTTNSQVQVKQSDTFLSRSLLMVECPEPRLYSTRNTAQSA